MVLPCAVEHQCDFRAVDGFQGARPSRAGIPADDAMIGRRFHVLRVPLSREDVAGPGCLAGSWQGECTDDKRGHFRAQDRVSRSARARMPAVTIAVAANVAAITCVFEVQVVPRARADVVEAWRVRRRGHQDSSHDFHDQLCCFRAICIAAGAEEPGFVDGADIQEPAQCVFIEGIGRNVVERQRFVSSESSPRYPVVPA